MAAAAKAKAQEPIIAGTRRDPREAELASAAAAARNERKGTSEVKSAFVEPAPEPNHSWYSSITSCCTPDTDEELEGSYANCPCYTAFMLSCIRCVGSSISYLAELIGRALSSCVGIAVPGIPPVIPDQLSPAQQRLRAFISKWENFDDNYATLTSQKRDEWRRDLIALGPDAMNAAVRICAVTSPTNNEDDVRTRLEAILLDTGNRRIIHALRSLLQNSSEERADYPEAREFLRTWEGQVIPASDSQDYEILAKEWQEDLQNLDSMTWHHVSHAYVENHATEIHWPEGKENRPAVPNDQWSPSQQAVILKAIESDVGNSTVLHALDEFLNT